MKVYLAARLSRAEEMLGYAAELERRGFEVTSRWIQGGHEWVNVPDETMPIEIGRQFAIEDLADLRAADGVVAFTESPDAKPSRGGRHVEVGYAMALDKPVIVIGPAENVFYCLATRRYETFADLLAALDRLPLLFLHVVTP